jgi:hypothetical protein
VHLPRLPGSGLLEIGQNVDQLKLLGRAEHGTHAGNFGNFLGLELGVAAHDGHESVGVVLEGLLHHLPALAVGVVGHRAGIDNV